MLHRIISNSKVHIVHEKIQEVQPHGDGSIVVLTSGERIPVVEAVLEIKRELGD